MGRRRWSGRSRSKYCFMKTLWHLVKRFTGSLQQKSISERDHLWVQQILSYQEMVLWESMPQNDQHHSIEVARRVDKSLEKSEQTILTAALLHDIGKVTSKTGVGMRVLATLIGVVTSEIQHKSWSQRPGRIGEIGRYLCHAIDGASLLQKAGSDSLVVTWASEHHLPQHQWTINLEIGKILKSADDD